MHLFVGLQQVFSHGHVEVAAQTFGQQQAGDAVGAVGRAGQQQQALLGAQGLGQRVQAVRGWGTALPLACVGGVHGDDACVLPGQAHAGTGQLQGREVGQDLQRVQAQVLGKVGCDAVAQRVAGGQHHAGLVGLACGAHPAGHGLQLSCQVVGEGAGLECVAEQRQRARAANHHVGRAQVGQRGGAEAGHAVVEHTDDAAAVGIVGGKIVHSVSKSEWWVWPMPVRPAVAGRGRASAGAERTSATGWPLKSHTSTRSAKAWP